MNREDALLACMEQIYQDIKDGEGQPLYDLIDYIPTDVLIGYLQQAERYEKLRYN